MNPPCSNTDGRNPFDEFVEGRQKRRFFSSSKMTIFYFGGGFWFCLNSNPPCSNTRRVRESDLIFIKTSAFAEFVEGSGAAMRRPEPF